MEFQFKTGEFEGPLDLLLFLISKNKMDILKIEISILLDQFLEYLNEMHSRDLEVTSNFLEMAARLVYIKTVSLLPPERAEIQNLKATLQGELLELSIVKNIADKLFSMDSGFLLFTRKPLELNIKSEYNHIHKTKELLRAQRSLIGKIDRKKPPSPEVFTPLVARRKVSVTSRIVAVLKSLYKTGKASLDDIYKTQDKAELVATFLAILELVKSGRINIDEENMFIYFVGNEEKVRS